MPTLCYQVHCIRLRVRKPEQILDRESQMIRSLNLQRDFLTNICLESFSVTWKLVKITKIMKNLTHKAAVKRKIP